MSAFRPRRSSLVSGDKPEKPTDKLSFESAIELNGAVGLEPTRHQMDSSAREL
jgi:hypothetical protein